MTIHSDYIIGIDIGGTDTKIGLVRRKGEILDKVSIKTIPEELPDNLIDRIFLNSSELLKKNSIEWDKIITIGIATPGVLDIKNGIILFSPNMKNWIGVPIVALVQEKFKLSCILENDANAAAWGERWAGSSRGEDINSLVLITLGTGVGGGIIIKDEIWRGAHNVAGELGHMTIDPNGKKCGCGNYGCLEAYASATAIEQSYKELNSNNIESVNYSCETIYNAALNKNKIAKKVFEDAGRYLGIAIVNVMHCLNPDIIVIGGGMSAAKNLLYNSLHEEINKRACKIAQKFTKVVFASLKNNAGMIGAAGWALKTLETSV